MNNPIERKNFDFSIKPTDDFYQHVNGNWLRENPLPPSESRWGTFMILRNQSTEALRKIICDIADGDHEPGSNRQKIKDFYLTAIDEKKSNKDGIEPLASEFERIASVRTIDDLVSLFAHLQLINAGGLWECGVGQDAKNSGFMILYLSQSGLGLPDRDYYIKTDEKSVTLRKQYRTHMTAMFRLLGENDAYATNAAARTLELETMLAEASMSRLEARDPLVRYNKFSVSDLESHIPDISWKLYFEQLGLPQVQHLIVQQPKFLEKVSELLHSISLDDWKLYCRWHLINSTASLLSDVFVEQNFAFYGKILGGQKEIKPRWERSVMMLDSALGEALGQEYVTKYFPPRAKQQINELVDNLIAAYRERITALDWMEISTKEKALEKLGNITRKLGYPNTWKDYSALDIKSDAYVLNVIRSGEFESRQDLEKMGKPVNREEWHMTPQTVNAYFSPTMNEVVFPAAIMQSPFFHPDADDAVNYAGIGAVIGHELTHGFDDQGSKYDLHGNLTKWWTEADYEKFRAKAAALAEQFNRYKVTGDLSVNGELTLGENIADLGGLSIAYDALQRALQKKGRPGLIDGFTPEQRFFLNWAQIWRGNISDELARKYLTVDVHSPGKFRVLGPLSNVNDFYEAFDCKPTDAMYRLESERARVW